MSLEWFPANFAFIIQSCFFQYKKNFITEILYTYRIPVSESTCLFMFVLVNNRPINRIKCHLITLNPIINHLFDCIINQIINSNFPYSTGQQLAFIFFSFFSFFIHPFARCDLYAHCTNMNANFNYRNDTSIETTIDEKVSSGWLLHNVHIVNFSK